MFGAACIIRELNNFSYKGYVLDKLKSKVENDNSNHAEAILDSLEFKDKEKNKYWRTTKRLLLKEWNQKGKKQE